MVRHYESLGLLPRVGRTDSGYRQYSEAEVHTLRFIKRSRELGFSMDEIAELVSLWQNRRAHQRQRQAHVAQKHADALTQRIDAMLAMQRTLDHLIHCCHGDDRPDCPILDDLHCRRAGTDWPGRHRYRGLVGLAGCCAPGYRAHGLVPALCIVWLQHLQSFQASVIRARPRKRPLPLRPWSTSLAS
jgi:MerR family copper efflux transcriptional regulator